MEEIDDLDELFKKGYSCYWEGDYKAAFKYFDKSIKKEGDHYLKSFYKGQALYSQGKLSESVIYFIESLEKNQDFIEGFTTLTKIYQKLGKNEEALQISNEILNKKPSIQIIFETYQSKVKIIDVLQRDHKKVEFENDFEQGLWNHSKGYYPDAKAFFESFLKSTPSGHLAYLFKAISECKMQHLEEAIHSIEKFIEMEPEYDRAWYIKTKILKRSGNYPLAIASCKKALELNPKSALFKDTLSRLYTLQDKRITSKRELPTETYTNITSKRKDPFPPLFGIGLMLYTVKKSVLREDKKDNDLAKYLAGFIINEYVMLQIDFLSLYYGISNQIKLDEILSETIEIAKRLIRFTRRDPEAFDFYNEALGYVFKSRISIGIKLIEKAIELSPHNPMYLIELYRTYHKIGDFKKATEIGKEIEERGKQLKNNEYLSDEFENLKSKLMKKTPEFSNILRRYDKRINSDKGLILFLSSITSEIIKYLKGENSYVNDNDIAKVIDDCLQCLELFSLIASQVYFKLHYHFGDEQLASQVKTAIIDILGWEPEPLSSIQTPNFLSPKLRKKSWLTTLGMDVLSFRMMNSIQEARYVHIDGDVGNDDPKTHAWYSKETADQLNITEQHQLHDKAEITKIQDHIGKHFGEGFKILHTKKSSPVHIDIHIIPPTKDRQFALLITSGMSERPMNSPPDAWKWWRIDISKVPEESRKGLNCEYAELVIKLPPDWPIPREELKNDEYFWPIEELHHLINYVHINNQWFWDGHTMRSRNDDSMTFSKNTKLSGWLFLYPSPFLPPEFTMLKISSSKMICFLQLIPLYIEEIKFAMQNSKQVLLKKFDQHGIKDYIDINRPNVCKP